MQENAWKRKEKLTGLVLIVSTIVLSLLTATARGTPQPSQEPAKATSVQPEATELGTHERVWAAQLSSDGKYLVSSGAYDGTVTVWDLSKKKQLMALDLEAFAMRAQFDAAAVQGFAFSPDGRWLAGSYDENVTVWEAAKGRQAHRLSGSSGPVGFTVSGGKTEAFGGGGGHSKGVRAVAFSPDGRLLATGSEDNTIKLWDLSKGKVARTLTGHNGGVWALAFSPDGRSVVSGSNDTTIKFWDTASGQTMRTLEGHKTGIRALALSADGRVLASGEVLAAIKLWDLSSGEARELNGHRGGTNKTMFSSDGRWLASTGADRVTRLWEVATGREILNFSGGGGGVAFSGDGLRLYASGWSDDKVKVWQVELTQKTKN